MRRACGRSEKTIAGLPGQTLLPPRRAQSAVLGDGELQIDAAAQGYAYTTPLTGKVEAGMHPERDTGGMDESGAFFTQAEAEGFHYRVPMCGTSYCKS